jgi:hypothetical protein
VISASLSYCVFFQTVSKIKEIWYGSLKLIKIKNEKGVFAFYIETFTISCDLNLSQNHPRIIPRNSHRMLMINPLAILNPTSPAAQLLQAGEASLFIISTFQLFIYRGFNRQTGKSKYTQESFALLAFMSSIK